MSVHTVEWVPAGPDFASVFALCDDPLLALSKALTPALVLRQAYSPKQCRGLVERLLGRRLMAHPRDVGPGDPKRIDIGTSLGNRGKDREDFLAHSADSHEIFATLFDGFEDPVALIYRSLQRLAGDKVVMTAREPDGRRYGPAIIRVHYETQHYDPHIDHVTLREKRFDYAVTRFEHQFAGVLCVQNASVGEATTQAILHRCLWTEEIQPHLEQHAFADYARNHNVEQYQVDLSPGDLYFFNTRCIHEVPPVVGTDPRIVLAVFIGYSPGDPEVFVWS